MKNKKEKSEERDMMFLWGFMVLVIPIGIFLIVNACMGWGFNPKFLADNVLIYYGTIIGSCLSGAITFIGLVYTLKQNSENLKQQKKDLYEDYQRQLKLKIKYEHEQNIEDAIFNLYELKSYITAYYNLVINKELDKNMKRIEKTNISRKILLCSYKMKHFNEKFKGNELEVDVNEIDKKIGLFMEKVFFRSEDVSRVDLLRVINEYIEKLKKIK